MHEIVAAALRRRFLQFFAQAGHTIVKSSPLVPQNDPTLMFVNAGMVPFKDVFVGADDRPYKRAVSAQKCLRVSGKHNDLEEVGRTSRHHTFFEMLGNFSFGDYFKEEAIALAWTFATKEMGLDPQRIWITVFGGSEGVVADDEARQYWRKATGFSDAKILSMGMKDNFWAMGETGPCGPCSEMHYFVGSGSPDDVTPADFDNGRVVEFWNNVFMQFDRQSDGRLVPLPAPSVDTGLGLERLAALAEGSTSNYHTGLFLPLLEAVAEGVGKAYRRGDSDDDVSMRVIADHARATAFLVADGVRPANEGRGYVLRRIMRRAIRHGKRLGYDEAFFSRICDVVVQHMGEPYPELHEARSLIDKVARTEEEGFRRTLEAGLSILAHEIARSRQRGGGEIAGEVVFKLYDTYGFPKDLTEVIARESALTIDEAGFAHLMEAQRSRSRGGEVGGPAVPAVYQELRRRITPPPFVGYVHEDAPLDSRPGTWRRRDDQGEPVIETQTQIVSIMRAGAFCDSVGEGEAEIVLDPTPFYGEAGGQVGDRGFIRDDAGAHAEVLDTQKPLEMTIARVRLRAGTLRAGQSVWAGYNPRVRKATRAHHSATHILHASLRAVLGDHVKQAGSWVAADKLRFDYSHFAALSDAQRRLVEDDANARVSENADIVTDVLPYDRAKKMGAIALFGEKYGDVVRVVTMGSSVEFCGGTHARRTGDIGIVLITGEEAVASGVRRLEAEVGEAAQRHVAQTAERLQRAAAILASDGTSHAEHPVLQAIAKIVRQYHTLRATLAAAGDVPATADTRSPQPPVLASAVDLPTARRVRDSWQALVHLTGAHSNQAAALAETYADNDAFGVIAALARLQEANQKNQRLAERIQRSTLAAQAQALLATARDIAGVRVLTSRVGDLESKALRQMADAIRASLGSGILCLAAESVGNVTMLVAVTKDLTGRFKAGNLIKELAPLIGGRGGGKPELAAAGGSLPEAVDDAFAKLRELVAAG